MEPMGLDEMKAAIARGDKEAIAESNRIAYGRAQSRVLPLTPSQADAFALADPVGFRWANTPRRAMTGAERVHKHEMAKRDIGAIPPVADPDRRERCRTSLLAFGLTYCGALLNHPPSERMVRELIEPLQRAVIGGGQTVIQFPRSTGKSCWTKIAMLWAILYGYRRFVVVIAATLDLAGDLFNAVIEPFSRFDLLASDFPAVALPIRDLGGDNRRARNQTANGLPCGIAWKGNRFRFPSAKSVTGQVIDEASAGSMIVAASVGGAVKGIVNEGERPDMVFLDDPQTRRIAQSASDVTRAEQFIVHDVLGLAGQTTTLAAVMAITPMMPGDLCSRFTDRKIHPEWHVASSPYVTRFSQGFDEAYLGFALAYQEDVAIDDRTYELSRRYYLEHKAEFDGTEVLDPANVAPGEIDAVHHLLVLKARLNDDDAFNAEYMMKLADNEYGEALDADEVVQNVNGFEPFELPPGTTDVVAFCDVNIQKESGLRFALVAFGAKRVSAVVALSRYPEDGKRLIPDGAAPHIRATCIANGIKEVTKRVLMAPLHLHGSDKRIFPTALAFDMGYETETVYNTVTAIANGVNLHGMAIMCTRGESWKQWRDDTRFARRTGDHFQVRNVQLKDGRMRKYLAVHADYWREIAQRSLAVKYPAPGSCSLNKFPTALVHQFAAETTYEQLVETYRDASTGRKAWKWVNARKGSNHWCDVLYNCFTLAAVTNIYSAEGAVGIHAKRVGTLPTNGKEDWIAGTPAAAAAPQARPRPAAPKKLFKTIKRPRFVK